MTNTLLVTLSAVCALSAAGCVTTTTAPEPASPPAEPAPMDPAVGAIPPPVETPAMPAPTDPAPTTGAACSSDSDCVPASCCHATACVPRGSAPECSNTMCTKECRGGTLDCGGHCLCQNGTCNAQLSNAM